jgi:hypothetical protein
MKYPALQGSQRHSFPEFSYVVYQPNRSQECRLCMPARFLDCEGAEQAKPKVGDGGWRRVEETSQNTV